MASKAPHKPRKPRKSRKAANDLVTETDRPPLNWERLYAESPGLLRAMDELREHLVQIRWLPDTNGKYRYRGA